MMENRTNADLLKQKLRGRKDRRRSKKSLQNLVANLTDEEREQVMKTAELQEDTDRKKEDNALIQAVRRLQKEETEKLEREALKKTLADVTEDQAKKILENYEDEVRVIENKFANHRAGQRESLMAKLAARKRMKEALNKDEAVSEELDRITKAQAAKGDEESAEVISRISQELCSEKNTDEKQELIDKQIEKQAYLDKKQREEARLLEQQMEEELARSNRAIAEQIDAQKKLAVDAHNAKFEQNIMLQGKNLSEDEVERMMARHKDEVKLLENNLTEEKDRQRQLLAEKVAARKKRRLEQLSEKQKIDMTKELLEEQQERDHLNDKLARDVEGSTLKSSVKGKDGKAAENMIYNVLRQRHMKEAIHLEEQHESQLEAAKAEARAHVLEQRQTEREKLLAAFDQELLDLVSQSGVVTPAELEHKRQEIKSQQARQLRDFDNLTTQMELQAQKDVVPRADIEHTHASLALKEKQLMELADAMRTMTPEEKLIKQYEAEALEAQKAAQDYHNETLKAMREEQERQKREVQQREEEKKRKFAEKFAAIEADLLSEQKRQEELEQLNAAERERIRLAKFDEQQNREAEKIKTSGASEDEKDRLLREHEENRKRFAEQLNNERARGKDSLEAKLAARRKKRLASEKAKVEKELQLDTDQDIKIELMTRAKEEAQVKREAQRVEVQAQAAAAQQQSSQAAATPYVADGNAEQTWLNMLMASPLFKQVNDLDDLIQKAVSDEVVNSQILGANYQNAYIDAKDAQWNCKGDLVPVDINTINPSKFVVYRFGVFVLQLLRKSVNAPDITLLLASNLPPNNYERNAFRRSFNYQHARKILFIREERLESIGDFIVVLLHALAHIKVGDLTDDAHPLFLRNFYKYLRVTCLDMFFSRSRNTPASQALTGGASGRPALDAAFHYARSPDDKISVVEELVDVKVNGPSQMDFSERKITDRMQKYESFSSNARLREYLASQGGVDMSTDFVSVRMAELKGEPIPEPQEKKSPSLASKQMSFRSQKRLLDVQVQEMQGRLDAMNEEMTTLLLEQSQLKEGLRRQEESGDKVKATQTHEKLSGLNLNRESLTRQIEILEIDIKKKQKDMAVAK